jgi:hypothetical protein
MTQSRLVFQSELRAAVSEMRAAAPVHVVRQPAAPAKKRTRVRLWLPLTPIWFLLAPLALIAAPALALAKETRGLPPYRTAFAVGAALLGLSGTVIDIDSADAVVRIRIL